MKKNQENQNQTTKHESEYYDGIAQGYDELHQQEQTSKIKIMMKYIKPEHKEKLLDIGFGTGIILKFLECNITGIEPSKKMLEIAKQKIKLCESNREKKQKNNVVIIRGNDEYVKKLNAQEYDYVTCITAAHHFRNQEETIKEIKRITKKTSTIIFSLLKTSKTTKELEQKLTKKFTLIKKIDEKKDIILILKQKIQINSK